MAWVRMELEAATHAVLKAGLPILAIVLTHGAAVVTGAVMVHVGNEAALSYRGKLVAQAHASDPVSLASQQGDDLQAAFTEAARTQWACVALGVTGLTIVSPFVLSAYRG
jgi:hypothetical protein